LNPTSTTPPCYNNTILGNRLYAWRKSPNVTNPICWTCKNCSYEYGVVVASWRFVTRVQLLCLWLKPVNTTRVNAADIQHRVAALKSDRSHNNPNKAGFFEEFEVDCCHRLFCVFFLLLSLHLPPFRYLFLLTYMTMYLSKLNMN